MGCVGGTRLLIDNSWCLTFEVNHVIFSDTAAFSLVSILVLNISNAYNSFFLSRLLNIRSR